MENKFSIQAIIQWVVIVALGLTPIAFAPITQDFYDTNKLALLSGCAGVLLILSGLEYLIQKKPVSFHISHGVIAFGALLLGSLISFVVASTGKVDALIAPLGFVSMLSLTIILLTLSKPSEELKTLLTWVFTGSTAVLGLITLYQFVGMGRIMFPSIPFLQNPLWTPTGATTTTIALLAVAVTLIFSRMRLTIGKPHMQNPFIFYTTSILVTVAALVLTLIEFIPKIPTSIIPPSAAWSITLETLKHAKAAAFGVGAENFVSAYTMGKPLSMMATVLWNVRFGVNADFYLHMATIYGLVGLVASLIFTLQFIKRFNSPIGIASIVYVLCLLIVPPTLTILAVGAILLILSDPGHSSPSGIHSPRVRYILGAIFLILGAGVLYTLGRAYMGERQYFMALVAAQQNEGTNTYNRHIAAIHLNPYVARYHITFSQINLSLANSVANPSTQSGQNKDLMNQLIQQAISEAKIAVTLNPQSITGWENLGATYQVIMPIAEGSDTWAEASYQKALTIDPTNPLLWVNLGGVLVHQKKYDNAIVEFGRATVLRPDYANAYYNLANAYKLKGDTVNATAALTKTMDLVAPGSSDYAKVKNELNGSPAVPVSAPSQLTLPR